VRAVIEYADRHALAAFVADHAAPESIVSADELGYAGLPGTGRGRARLNHSPRQPRSLGITTGRGSEKSPTMPRKSCDPLSGRSSDRSGVSNHDLHEYVAVFPWVENPTVAVPAVGRVRLGLSATTEIIS